MASTIRLADAGLPETPPPGSARIFIGEYRGRLHLKMLRPDGTIEIFGNLELPIDVLNGGTGTSVVPNIGQVLIGNGTGYNVGNIVAGNKISIVSNQNQIEINADVQDFSVNLETPPELSVSRVDSLGATTLTLNKVVQQAHKIYAGPVNGVNAEPTFRLLVQEDIPDLDSSKIIQFEDRVCEIIPQGLAESVEIAFNYDQDTNKTGFSIKDSGVISGIYGNGLEIPVFTVNSKGIITSATTVNIKESVEDYVGDLIQSSDSVNAEYDDLNAKLLLHVNNEAIITTNISELENIKAPTSQSIKQYVDDNLNAERNSRITADTALNQILLDERIFARYDDYTISTQDIARGYITLPHKNILLESVTALIDRVPLLQGIDFVISKNLDNDVIFTFTGDILPNQPLALQTGENLRVNYLFRV